MKNIKRETENIKKVHYQKIKNNPEKYRRYLEKKENYRRKGHQIKIQEKISENK
jgi:hypothetical protein